MLSILHGLSLTAGCIFGRAMLFYTVVSSLRIQGEDVRGTVGTLFDQIRDHFVKGKVSSAKNYILNAALVAQNKHAVSVMDKINTSKWVGCERSSSYPGGWEWKDRSVLV